LTIPDIQIALPATIHRRIIIRVNVQIVITLPPGRMWISIMMGIPIAVPVMKDPLNIQGHSVPIAIQRTHGRYRKHNIQVPIRGGGKHRDGLKTVSVALNLKSLQDSFFNDRMLHYWGRIISSNHTFKFLL